MHPEIRMLKPGRCPICGMSLIPIPAEGEGETSVLEEDLREFCEERIRSALERAEEQVPGEAFAVVPAYVEGAGNKALPRLRELLAGPDLNYVSAAASQLAELNAREVIPQLKKLLKSKSLVLATAPAGLHVDVLNARLSVACALYQMEDPDGLRALLEMSEGPWRGFTYPVLTVRDTPEARRAMERGAASRNPVVRAEALGALVHLGEKRHVKDIIGMLESSKEEVRNVAVSSLARAALPETEQVLKAHLSREDVSHLEKLAAASGLVRLGKREYMQHIVDRLKNPKEGWKPIPEIYLLGELGNEEQLPVLRRLIERDPFTRTYASAAALKIM